MNLRKLLASAGLVTFLAVGVVYWFWIRPETVATVRGEARELSETLLVSGHFVQQQRSRLGVALQSTVERVDIVEGQRVEAGELLLVLAADEQRAALAEAEGAVREAEARLRGRRGAGSAVLSEVAAAAQLEVAEAEREFARQQALYQSGAVSESELSRSRLARDAANSRHTSALLQESLNGASGTETRASAAVLERAKARLAQVRAQLDRTELRAPFAGRILSVSVRLGEVVRPGEVLMELLGAEPLSVEIHPDESFLAKLRVGQTSLVSPEAYPDMRLPARIERIAPTVDTDDGTVTVDIALSDDAPPAILPDMTASVEVELAREHVDIAVPTRVVQDLAQSPWVGVVRGGVLVRAAIEVGLKGEEWVEVTSGLTLQDAIVDQLELPALGRRVRGR